MKDRIRFISHKGKKILLVDCTNCAPDELEKITHLVPQRVAANPKACCCCWLISPGPPSTRESWTRSKKALCSTGLT